MSAAASSLRTRGGIRRRIVVSTFLVFRGPSSPAPVADPVSFSDRLGFVSFSSDRIVRVRLGDRSGSNRGREPKQDRSRRTPTRQKVARVRSNQVDAMVASRKSGNPENGTEEGEKQTKIRSVSKKEGERNRGQEETETVAAKPGSRKKVQIALISTSGALVIAGGVLGLVLGLVGRSKRRKRDTKEEKQSPRRVSFREAVENIEVTPYSSEGLEDEDEEEVGIVLRVVSGPSSGLAYLCTKSQDRITVGRSEGNDLAVGDGEVSTVHVFINWSEKMQKWAVIDVGSLNGTRLNDELLKSSGRSMTYPYPLLDGDLIRLGSQTVIRVNYEPVAKNTVKTGRRADSLVISAALSASPSPEHLRAKQPIEDVCGVECPLRGFFKVGLFCLFDGHCGDNAAKKAKELLPQEISKHFFDFGKKALAFREEEETRRGLQAAIASTDKLLDFQYEGCTATAMLIWEVNNEKYLQVANVGDSACVLGVRPKAGAARGIVARQVTVDHRVSNKSERDRLIACGAKLPENATRLHGLSLSRALGDQFLKSQNVGLVSDPHVSEIVKVQSEEEDVVFAIIASDGLWDAVSPELAVERAAAVGASSQWRPDVMSSQLLRLAKKKKSTDDVSVLLVHF